jgi:hypothetical protein
VGQPDVSWSYVNFSDALKGTPKSGDGWSGDGIFGKTKQRLAGLKINVEYKIG